MEYTVVITKKHCIGRKYQCTGGCPLFAAIKEQLPNFPIRSVGGDYVRDEDFDLWHFETGYKIGWGVWAVWEIENGTLDSFTVTFRNKNKKVQPSIKTVTKYVSVPETINDQAKKLILP